MSVYMQRAYALFLTVVIHRFCCLMSRLFQICLSCVFKNHYHCQISNSCDLLRTSSDCKSGNAGNSSIGGGNGNDVCSAKLHININFCRTMYNDNLHKTDWIASSSSVCIDTSGSSVSGNGSVVLMAFVDSTIKVLLLLFSMGITCSLPSGDNV